MTGTRRRVRDLRSRDGEAGATTVEYGLIVALVALVTMSGAGFLGQRLTAGFDTAARRISGIAVEDAAVEAPVAAAVEDAVDDAGTAGATTGAAKDPRGKSADAPGWGDGSGGGRDR